MNGKPHIFYLVEGAPVIPDESGKHCRFILVNSDGEFRTAWTYHFEQYRPAIEARLRGDTHFQGEPCPDCGCTDYYALPLSVNTRDAIPHTLGKSTCYYCRKHPEAHGEERRKRAAGWREFFEKEEERKQRDRVTCFALSRHYGTFKHNDRSTKSTREQARALMRSI